MIGTALGQHRFGPVALAAGLASSFVVIGLFLATIGFTAGVDQELFRSIAAMVLILVGGVLLMPRLQLRLAAAAGPMGNWAHAHACDFSTNGLVSCGASDSVISEGGGKRRQKSPARYGKVTRADGLLCSRSELHHSSRR